MSLFSVFRDTSNYCSKMENSSNIEEEIKQEFEQWKKTFAEQINTLVGIKAKLYAGHVDNPSLKCK